MGQIAHALLTRPPLEHQNRSSNVPARLACVRHAASVRPEPGSNSDVQSFPSTPSPARTRQSPRFLPRQGVSLIRNLTVLSLSSFSLCIVFKNRRRRSVPRDNVDYYTNAPIICQGFSAKNFTHNILWFISCILCYILRFLAVFSRKSREFELLRNRFFKKKTATGSIQMTHTRPCFSAESPEKVGTSPGKALSSSR